MRPWVSTAASGSTSPSHAARATPGTSAAYLFQCLGYRTLTIDLGFLGEGAYTAELFRDGVNADKAARDYKRESVEIPADRKLTVKMAPGGGFALKVSRK